ncbi:MAG: EamA family transporter [Nitrososphaerota archaeon]|nr:EamA family transporter [Nitrososphaerota archaeon]
MPIIVQVVFPIEMSENSKSKAGAFGIALLATALWGLSGTAAQLLFQKYSFPPLGLVTLRLFIASAMLFVWLRPKWPGPDSKQMLLFGIFGILPSQLFYFLAINYSNVAMATLLQLLFLPIVAVYEILIRVYKFTFSHLAAILLAMGGTVLLVLNGPSLSLHITPLGFLFGTLCALAAAYYTLASKRLTVVYGSWSVTAWGFLIAGVVSLPIGTISLINASFTIPVILLILFVGFFGTLLAYGLYVMSLQRLTATEASITATGEPITASIASYVFIGVLLSPFQYLGGGLILVAMYFLRNVIRKPEEESDNV